MRNPPRYSDKRPAATDLPASSRAYIAPDQLEPRPGLRQQFEAYLRSRIAVETAETSPEARLAWRLSRYDNGLRLLELARQQGLDVARATVLDAGGAFGGDILPFAACGARALVTDWLDHDFQALIRFAQEQGLTLGAFPADSMQLPLPDACIELVLSLDVVEHLPEPARFAGEVARVLKPGGMAFVTTPPRWRFLRRDPHYGVPLLHGLPHAWREPVARRIFRARYPYPVYRIYASADEATAHFRAHGLHAEALMPFTAKAFQLEQLLPAPLFQQVKRYAWDVLILRK